MAMGLFDYDARPATPQVQLVGDRSSAAAYALRDFLTRNGLPYDWQEVDGTGGTGDPADLPLCILPDGRRIARATVEQVAAGLGMISPPQLDVYDLVIVGAERSNLRSKWPSSGPMEREMGLEPTTSSLEAMRCDLYSESRPNRFRASDLSYRLRASSSASVHVGRRTSAMSRDIIRPAPGSR